MRLMGGYYGEWLARDKVIDRQSCGSAAHIYIWADTDQRTLETGKAMAEGLLPSCVVGVHSFDGKDDPLFDPIAAGLVKQEPGASDRAALLVKEAPASHRDGSSRVTRCSASSVGFGIRPSSATIGASSAWMVSGVQRRRVVISRA